MKRLAAVSSVASKEGERGRVPPSLLGQYGMVYHCPVGMERPSSERGSFCVALQNDPRPATQPVLASKDEGSGFMDRTEHWPPQRVGSCWCGRMVHTIDRNTDERLNSHL
jgi:hypothetical protein